jgi:GNAT superfamily N-acetyltransferase
VDGDPSDPVPGLVIRPLAPTDSLGELTDLLHRAYAQLRTQGLHYVASHQDEATTRRRVARGECYVGERSGRLVATVTFKPTSLTAGCDWYDRPEVASFRQLAVDPELHRNGIGSALVALAEQRAGETGATEISLDTSEKADSLIGWYLRRGYRFVGQVSWPMVNYRSVILSKSLDGEGTSTGAGVPFFRGIRDVHRGTGR